jgi:hypothetical protein
VFYIQEESEPSLIAYGDKLGDMTDEMKPGEYIDEFISGGPKNYAYKIHNQDVTKEMKTMQCPRYNAKLSRVAAGKF